MPSLSFLVGILIFVLLKTIHVYSDSNDHKLQSSTATTTTTATAREFSLAWISQSFSFDEQENQQRDRDRDRDLQRTGDVWRACSGNKTKGKQTVTQNNTEYTDSIYEYTDYDDEHKPTCKCFFDTERSEYWAQCALGDESCNADTNVCTGIHEFFLFSDLTGDLKQKSSCNLCQDVNNCNGVQETCTIVVFNKDATPNRCVLKEIHSDGTETRCDRCTICRDDSSGILEPNYKYGISHDCFGEPTPTLACDTDGIAHLHNFAPVMDVGTETIGGAFGRICQKDEEEALYGMTNYDDDYTKICDCKDPTQGLIVCDLFVKNNTKDCFANECTEFSEFFYFDANGELNQKTTCDLNDLCTTVTFSEKGQPMDCFVFSPENLVLCDVDTYDICTVCKDESSQQYGVHFDCFEYTLGNDEIDTCSIDEGRAVFNLGLPTPSETKSPSIVNNNPDKIVHYDSNNNQLQLQLVLVAVFGGIAFALAVTVIVTLCSSAKRKADTEVGHVETISISGEIDSEPPEVLVDQHGQPMIKDPTPIAIT